MILVNHMPPRGHFVAFIERKGAFWCILRAPKGPNTERPTGHMPCTPDGQSTPDQCACFISLYSSDFIKGISSSLLDNSNRKHYLHIQHSEGVLRSVIHNAIRR